MDKDKTSSKAKRYSAVKTRFLAADLLLSIVSLVLFQFLFSRSLSNVLFRANVNFYISLFLYSGIFLLFAYIVSFPLHVTNSFFVEIRFGMTERCFRSWLVDEVKSILLSFVLCAVCIQVFYLVLRNFSSLWWVILAFLWILFSVVLTRFLPVLLLPLFYKYLPIEDVVLRDRILELAKRTKIDLTDVCRIDFSKKTKKANAALIGLGKTRKVILADTLVEEFSLEEVETVVAHEFGHHRYKHIWRHLAFSGGITLIGFFLLFRIGNEIAFRLGATGIADPYLFPTIVFLMIVSGLVILPAQNFFSRVLERQADRFALDSTEKPEVFVSVMKKLAEMNLADTEPSTLKKIFLYSHPPVSERIRMGEKWRERNDV